MATSTCATSATTFGLSTEPSPTSAWDPAASSGTSTPRWPLLALPGFLVAHALVRLGLAPGPADGYGEAYVAGATSMALLLGLLGLWMLLRLGSSQPAAGSGQTRDWALLGLAGEVLVRCAGVGAAVFTALIAPQVGVSWQWPKEDS